MTLAQARLFEPAILIHVLAAVLALSIGLAVLAARKGTLSHRVTGRAAVLAMAITAGSSFFIDADLLPIATPLGRFGPIHLLSLFTLAVLAWAILAIRRGNVASHRRAVTGAYVGLAVAGLLALMPGRTLNVWLLTVVA